MKREPSVKSSFADLSLTNCMASSTFLTVRNGSSGPNISSFISWSSGVTLVTRVGEIYLQKMNSDTCRWGEKGEG